MFYDFAITIPAGTTESAPVEQELKLTHGVIHRVEVEFYPGPRRYVWIKIFHEEHQLYPTNPDGSFCTDGYTIAFDDYFELFTPPYSLLARGYSPNADYDHVVTVRIGVIESRIALATLRVAKALEKFLKVVGIKV
jgi:hypothetical protein